VPSYSYREPSPWRSWLKVFLIVIITFSAAGAGALLYLNAKFMGAKGPLGVFSSLGDSLVAWRDPRAYFPGRTRLTVLCLGLDRNIVKSRDPKINGMPSTKDARSDVIMVASLDLQDKTVSVLSIPRDTRVELPGRGYHKINQAQADGGTRLTRETVEQFLGITIDHHVVIKQEAIEAVVDAIGGVTLDVEKDMKYEDRWGQLFIDLKQGEQRLSGDQLVGYMRFRNDAEGDFGRIRRQQQAIQALAGHVKSPSVLAKAPGLIDAIRKYIQTDLTPQQQLALAHLFHRVGTENIQTASLPVADTPNIGGISYVEADEYRKDAVVDWIVRGDKEAMNRLIRVAIKNASGDRELYEKVYNCLRHLGFQAYRAGRADRELAATRAVQHGSMRGSARRVLEALGLGGNVEKADGRGPDVTLFVGKDLEGNRIVRMTEMLGEPPPPIRMVARQPPRERSSRRGRRTADVEVKTLEVEEPVHATVEEPVEVDPPSLFEKIGESAGETVSKPSPTPAPREEPRDEPDSAP
jgi:LCP family protein required for cell wall assembly